MSSVVQVDIDGRIVIDGALEIGRAPTHGWAAGTIAERRVQGWNPDDRLRRLVDEWRRTHVGDRSDPKLGIRAIRVTEARPIVEFAPTTWADVQAVRDLPPADSSRVPNDDGDSRSVFEFPLPNIASVHLVVETADSMVLIAQRSMQVAYHPGAWAASIEEGIEPKDADTGDAIVCAAHRGLAEELGIPLATATLTILGIIVEQPGCNPAIVIHARVPVSSCEGFRAADADEPIGACQLVPCELPALASRVSTSLRDGAVWHPTARYRLFRLMTFRFGLHDTLAALDRST